MTPGTPATASIPATALLHGRVAWVTGASRGVRRSVVRRFMPATALAEWVPQLRANVVIEGAGHWLQQERPAEITDLLLRFLNSL